ncbi:MAG: hypothetical protein ACJAYB_000045 [Psychromonas sp.]|jgi:hypothetical protein
MKSCTYNTDTLDTFIERTPLALAWRRVNKRSMQRIARNVLSELEKAKELEFIHSEVWDLE